MQPNFAGGSGAVWLMALILGIVMIGGYILALVAFWRAMKAHESIARTVADIARSLERPPTTKREADRFTFGD